MIVCSCNVFSDQQLRSTVAKATRRLRMSQVYDYLGGSPQCGRCAHTIKRIMEKIPANASRRQREVPVFSPTAEFFLDAGATNLN